MMLARLRMLDDVSGPFEPLVILPSQFFARRFRHAPAKEGERRLLFAVLIDAIRCFQNHLHARSQRERRLFRDAERWIMAEHDHDSVLPFERLCGLLDLDPSYVRRGLRRWRDEHAATDTPSPPDSVNVAWMRT